MSHFPSPLKLPKSVIQERHERMRQLMRSCFFGVILRAVIILGELIGVYFFGSAALLMDALASVIDMASSILLIICIRFAARPPDENHPFGHGRYEPLIGLQLGLMMILVGGGMLIQQVFMWPGPSDVTTISSKAWLIPLGAVVLLELSYQIVMGTAKRQNSAALAADAVHYRIDGATSLCATLSLFIGSFFPSLSHQIDHIGAIIIALLMVFIGINAARKNIHQLVDRAPEEEYFERVKTAALRVKGVKGTEKIRIQCTGPDAHVDIDVEVDPDLSVQVAHVISQKVRVEIQKEWAIVQDVTVHIEPFYPNDH